ncbi:MAG: 6,7-dimethyl-8-ribityllumazine synthase [Chloroflexi bacterium]|nr:6,7-dimethyl-8-ribityllumazine synthase [Chloroflexota bacterium]MYK60438.1 6,7-dimethyl-8-ribityllumazine synthase [Chloroflexota bacterium]
MAEIEKGAGESPVEFLDGSGLKIGIAVARFNSDITFKMRNLCLARLEELGVKVEESQIFEVPGSFELPLAARALLDPPIESDAVIAIGAVIRGQTDHYEHIANAASQGLLRVSEDALKPVVFGVLTTDTVEQAVERIGHASGYAESAVEMVNRLRGTRERRRGIGLV